MQNLITKGWLEISGEVKYIVDGAFSQDRLESNPQYPMSVKIIIFDIDNIDG
jgi:hypothetical protein